MFNYQVQTYENGEWQDIKRVALPITDGDVLDETLAEGKIDVKATSRQTPIKPFTPVRIKKYQDGVYKGTIQRVAGSTKRTTKRIVYPRTYDISAQLLELTKRAERVVIGTMTATKWLEHDYALTSSKAEPTTSESGLGSVYFIDPTKIPEYQCVMNSGDTLEVSNSFDWLKVVFVPGGNPQVTAASFTQSLSKSGTGTVQSVTQYGLFNTGDTSFSYELTSGSYTLTTYAEIDYVYGGIANVAKVKYEWEFVAYTEKETATQDFTITSIVQRLLSAGKTRRKGVETQLIRFNEAQATKYAQVPFKEPPEFAFTNDTLLDALLQIGGAIHAIPRLQYVGESENSADTQLELVFDELGGNEDVTAKMPKPLYEEKTYDINDFCGALDSPAQNMTNSRNIEKGCLSEFGNQYITMRTEETQVEISSDTVAHLMADNAHRIMAVYIYYSDHIYNVTPYVYEMDEYGTLSQLNDSQYPYSTGWALCYKKGTNKITGFNNKLTTATVLTKPALKYAIANILKAVGGVTLPDNDLINVAIRVVYVPEIQTRITQRKPIVNDYDDIELFYNQGANMVETSYFGQKMRGAVARLGQEITRRTYDFYNMDDIPKVGQLIDGAYIAQVDCAYYLTKVRVTVTLTPNFNLLSQYVGLNSNYRLSDIAKDTVYDRYITYGEALVFGNAATPKANTIIPLATAQNAVKKMLTDDENISIDRINTSMFIGYNEDANHDLEKIADSEVLRPCMSEPFGLSWSFISACYDNYGAGYQATDAFVVDGKQKRVQRLVPYTDSVGEMKYLGVWWSGAQVWENNAAAIADGGQANIYPKANATTEAFYKNNAEMKTGDTTPFIVEKDNRERIGVVYQMHLQANRDSVIIGSALADNCPLCTNYTANAGTAYVLPHTINTFGSVDLTGATNTTFTVNNGQIVVANPGIAGTKSWVIVDTQNNIYIGENTAENESGYFPTIYISTK